MARMYSWISGCASPKSNPTFPTNASGESNVITEMRITLRNRLRPNLSLVLPAGPGAAGFALAPAGSRPSATADAGAMPVRFKIPKEGLQLQYARYWIDKDETIRVSFTYLRSWLRYPAWMFLAALAAFGLLLFSTRFQSMPRRFLHLIGAALFVPAAWGAWRAGGIEAVFVGLLLGLLAVAFHRRWFSAVPEELREWGTTLAERFKKRDRDPEQWKGRRLLSRMLVTIGLCFFCLLLIEACLLTLDLLFYPLP